MCNDPRAMLSRVLGRILRLPLRAMSRTAVVRVLTGELRGARWIVGAATHGCWIGTYERDVQRIFATHIRPGDVVYDIGANAGFFTLLASRLAGGAGKVYSFEPLPRNLAYLRVHVRLNDAANVEVLPIAVSDSKGVVRLDTDGHPAMGGISEEGDLVVEGDSLDGLKLEPPSFLKMDIEGGEHAALRGATQLLRDARPTLLLSTHGYVQHGLCVELLESLGYAIELLRDGTVDGNYVVLATPAARTP